MRADDCHAGPRILPVGAEETLDAIATAAPDDGLVRTLWLIGLIGDVEAYAHIANGRHRNTTYTLERNGVVLSRPPTRDAAFAALEATGGGSR